MHGFLLVPPRAIPVPSPCHPRAQPLSQSLPGSVSCPPTVLCPCTHPGRMAPGRDGSPRVPRQGGGAAPPGCSWHRPSAVPTRAHPGCPAGGGWRQGPRTGNARRIGTASPVLAPPGVKGPRDPPPPYLPAGRDEVRLAGGTGLLLLHNNLVNGAWPAGEPGWRHHPLPAPPPPSGPAAPPAAARGAERSAGRAAGRVPRGRPAPSSILTPPERAAQHPQGPSSIPDSVPEHPGSVPASREHPPSISVSERRATPEHPRTSPAAERRSTPSIPRVPR